MPGLDLGHQPVGDLILSAGELNQPETHYPMQLHHCGDCGLTQLGYTVDPAVVYKNFPFVSGTTRTATEHLQELPRKLAKRHGLDRRHFAVDIGSNDGTLLAGWIPSGVRFLGVDPSGDPVRIANERGLPTWHAFFDADTAARIVKTMGRADAITACGCFAHIAALDSLMRGIVHLLAPDGVFVSDNQYWLDMVERLHWDNVFHQHLRYYALRPYQRLMQAHGLEVFDVERSEVYGGSVRFWAGRRGAHRVHRRVGELARLEDARALYDPRTNAAFARKVDARREKLFGRVHALRQAGRKVIGLGAPAKASTVCNACRLDRRMLDYVTEVNPLRIGMYLPGVHVPIVDERRMFLDARPADAGVLFAWNYRAEIVPKLRARGWKGEVICP
jgi:SAM-dependent methyltransferase